MLPNVSLGSAYFANNEVSFNIEPSQRLKYGNSNLRSGRPSHGDDDSLSWMRHVGELQIFKYGNLKSFSKERKSKSD